jgi:hypothetical protein
MLSCTCLFAERFQDKPLVNPLCLGCRLWLPLEWDILYRKYYNEEVKKLGI